MNPPITRSDPFFWLRDETHEDPVVLDYLKQENEYTESYMKQFQKVEDKLYSELLSHFKEDDEDYPYIYGDYYYYSKSFQGKAYPIHYRKKLDGKNEEVILDINKVAEGHKYSDVSLTLFYFIFFILILILILIFFKG